MKGTRALVGAVALLALGLAACGTGTEAESSAAPSSTAATIPAFATDAPGDVPAGPETPATTAATTAAGCSPEPEGIPFQEAVTATATTLLERSDGLVVEAVMYPHPAYEGRPWSQWGQGVTLADGRHFSAIGDHQARDGNSYVFEYDPATSTLTGIGDILTMVDHQDGAWGYGKVHAQMVQGACGEIYFSSYWGSRRNIEFADGYEGDILFEIDPDGRTITPHRVILSEHGVPSMAASPDGTLLYAEAVDPLIAEQNQGAFVVLDPDDDSIVFVDERTDHTGFRSIAVDREGRAYYSVGGGRLAVYDPATNEAGEVSATLPGEFLRAATGPAPDGTIYGATRRPDAFFALSPDGGIRDLGLARGYTTSMALSPDGSTFFYVPDAHGAAWQSDTPLVAVDTATGEDRVIVELDPLARDAFGIHLGGTYNITIDPSGTRLYIGMNAGSAEDDGFGEVVLVIVDLP